MEIYVNSFALRNQCEHRLAGLDIPRPFCLDTFTTAIARSRRRPLRVCPLPGLDGEDAPSGAWIATDTCDFVFVDASASPWHRCLIGLHEISHLLFDHPSEGDWLETMTAALLPDLDPAAARRILGRHDYSSRQEREAEFLASMILERAAADGPAAALPTPTRMVSRLSAVIEHPLRNA
jgi:hypothetical protein